MRSLTNVVSQAYELVENNAGDRPHNWHGLSEGSWAQGTFCVHPGLDVPVDIPLRRQQLEVLQAEEQKKEQQDLTVSSTHTSPCPSFNEK